MKKELTRTEHMCCKRTGKYHTHIIISADFLVDDAELMDEYIHAFAASHPDTNALILKNGSFMSDVLGISAEEFRDAVTCAALHRPGKTLYMGENKQYGIISENGEMRIVARGTKAMIFETIALSKNALALDEKPNYRAAQLHPDVLNKISELLISEPGTEQNFAELSWSNLISTDPENIKLIIDEIKRILFSPVKDFIAEIHVTQAQFARDLSISRRTVEDCCAGKTVMKPYIRLLVAQHYWLYKMVDKKTIKV